LHHTAYLVWLTAESHRQRCEKLLKATAVGLCVSANAGHFEHQM